MINSTAYVGFSGVGFIIFAVTALKSQSLAILFSFCTNCSRDSPTSCLHIASKCLAKTVSSGFKKLFFQESYGCLVCVTSVSFRDDFKVDEDI